MAICVQPLDCIVQPCLNQPSLGGYKGLYVIPISQVASVAYETTDGYRAYVSDLVPASGYNLVKFEFDPDLIGVEMNADGKDPGGYAHSCIIPFEYFTPEQTVAIKKLWKNPCVIIGFRRDNSFVIAGNTTEGFRLREHLQEAGKLAADNSVQTITLNFAGVEPQYKFLMFDPGNPTATDAERQEYTYQQLEALSSCGGY